MSHAVVSHPLLPDSIRPHLIAANVNFGQSVQSLLNSVAHAIPKIFVFLMILIIGWLVARALRSLVQSVLTRLHFDRFADRGVVGQAMSRSAYTASGLVARIAYYAIVLLVLQMAFGVFGPNPISHLLSGIIAWLPKAAVAIILIVVASAIAKVVKDLIAVALGGLSYGRFVATAASVFVLGLGIIAALSQIGIAASVTTPLLVSVLGTVGAIIAIGVGGGLIRPMQGRWERVLGAVERETNTHLAAYHQGRQSAAARPGGTAAAAGPERLVPTLAEQQEARSAPSSVPAPGHAAGTRGMTHAQLEPGTGQPAEASDDQPEPNADLTEPDADLTEPDADPTEAEAYPTEPDADPPEPGGSTRY